MSRETLQRISMTLFTAVRAGQFLGRSVARGIRHMNHILMGEIQRKLYRIITERIRKDLVTGGTVWMINYYDWLKKRYRHNYDRAHGLRNPGKEV